MDGNIKLYELMEDGKPTEVIKYATVSIIENEKEIETARNQMNAMETTIYHNISGDKYKTESAKSKKIEHELSGDLNYRRLKSLVSELELQNKEIKLAMDYYLRSI